MSIVNHIKIKFNVYRIITLKVHDDDYASWRPSWKSEHIFHDILLASLVINFFTASLCDE